MIIGVDAGYGYTKAVSENGEHLIFPSVVGAGFERKAEKLIHNGQSEFDNYELFVHDEHGEVEKHYFIGDLAILQAPDAARPFSADRSKLEEIKPILLTAIACLTRGEKVTLVTGLPLEPFFKQAKQLKYALEKMSGVRVTVNGEPSTIEFLQIIMFPQAIAALNTQLKRNNVGHSGVVGLIDMGFRTTDIIMYDLARKRILDGYKETIPRGMNDIIISIQDELKNETGQTANLEKIEQALVKQMPMYFARREYDITYIAAKKAENIAHHIVSNVKRRWGDMQNELKMVYLAGGGAYMLQPSVSEFANCEVVLDAQFANARGYLLRGLVAQEMASGTP